MWCAVDLSATLNPTTPVDDENYWWTLFKAGTEKAYVDSVEFPRVRNLLWMLVAATGCIAGHFIFVSG